MFFAMKPRWLQATVHLRRLPATVSGRRHFTVKAVYSSFPATLLYYSPRQQCTLFDERNLDDDLPNQSPDSGIKVDKTGLVYPAVDKTSSSNGAAMFPNTFFMQELIRRHYDENLDREDEGLEVETPFIYTIPRATPIPSHLILFNDFLSRFSLQPSRGMTLKDLNQAINEFFLKNAVKQTADEWLDQHPFHSALADDADEIWMAK